MFCQLLLGTEGGSTYNLSQKISPIPMGVLHQLRHAELSGVLVLYIILRTGLKDSRSFRIENRIQMLREA